MNNMKWIRQLSKSQAGFTLTEMLIVVAIIAMIGTLVTSQLFSRYNKAKVDSTKVQMRQLGTILDQYRLDCGFYPTTEQGLDALIEPPQTGRKCKSYDPDGYIKGSKVPNDGFDGEFIYFSDGRSFELRSLGQDGEEGGEGFDADISSQEIE